MLEANAEKYILFEDKYIIVCRKPPEELPGISREWETDSLSGGGSQAGSAGGGRSGIRQES